ncbi:translation initiation factor eIF-2B [Aeromicrobium camelliae]|uniref:Translation initiation factor eIF-2B n=1 Tax=Aeromicrobium camelliae TaxID=1538144 RepID=A0A3N6WPB6_9ACTN|nr:translation initiation factor eIF-2B [Aeromicrobium camelliae]RQN09289.1 translation initiation factor eIF-2B [Aeromicrobium camelliae]
MSLPDIEFTSADHVIAEIRDMNVKGGSPFGRAAAWAHRWVAREAGPASLEALRRRSADVAAQMAELKPTMATIANVNTLAAECLDDAADLEPARAALEALTARILDHSYAAVDSVAQVAAELIPEGGTVLMHSYSSTLVDSYRVAVQTGRRFGVVCTESRPLRESLNAVRLLREMGCEDVRFVTDAAMAESVRRADVVFLGADSLSVDGSVANKIGSFTVALVARHYGVPVYVLSELLKYDARTAAGASIELEMREPEEVLRADDPVFVPGMTVVNQFFDLTPPELVRGIVTERGVIPPYLVSSHWDALRRELLP